MTRPESVPQAIWDTLTPDSQACFAAVIGRLEQRIADLEARLNQNSTNSSRPPIDRSAGGLSESHPRSYRQVGSRGGQPGHHQRHSGPWSRPRSSPPSRPCKPPTCRRCHRPSPGRRPRPAGPPGRRMAGRRAGRPRVSTASPPLPRMRRDDLRRAPPGRTRPGRSGPGFRQPWGLLAGAYRLSKRQVQQLARRTCSACGSPWE